MPGIARNVTALGRSPHNVHPIIEIGGVSAT
jgi:hypothetical protein